MGRLSLPKPSIKTTYEFEGISGVDVGVESCKIMFLAGHFLFTCSATFTVACKISPSDVKYRNQVGSALSNSFRKWSAGHVARMRGVVVTRCSQSTQLLYTALGYYLDG